MVTVPSNSKYSLRKPRAFSAQCEQCGRSSGKVRLCERLDANLRPDRRRLCTACRNRLKFVLVNWARSSIWRREET